MPRQSDRYALDLAVELYTGHRWERLALQDLSRTGMFLTTTTALALGTPVIVAFTHAGERVISPARVTHCLGVDEARTLGRMPGVGVTFREPHEEAFAEAVEALLHRARTKQPPHMHVVVADPEPRVLERMSAALGDAGFSVATAATALELLGASVRCRPDLLIVDRATPIVDGLRLLEQLAYDEKLAAVPVIYMTSEAGEIELAFQRGAADAIMKPFSMLEMIARARRVAEMPRRAERMALSGSLSDIDLASVLQMLEQQRKTGRIVLSNGHAAWIDIVDGRVVDAGWSRDKSHPRAIVMDLLDWNNGTFRLCASPSRRGDVDLALPITHLLLEQARLRDEASRVRQPS